MTQERKIRLLRATFTLKGAFSLGHFVFSLQQKNVIIKTPRYQENSQFAGAWPENNGIVPDRGDNSISFHDWKVR
jgi:hypothetical protein